MMIDIEFVALGNTSLISFIFENSYKQKNFVEGMAINTNNIFMIGCMTQPGEIKKIIPYLDKGNKFILDQTWEFATSAKLKELLQPYSKNGLILKGNGKDILPDLSWGIIKHIPLFFWYNEFLHLKRHKHKIVLPSVASNKRFLMPIWREKPFRTQFINLLGSRIKESIYSKVYDGIYLPGSEHTNDDRYVDDHWYLDTGYSMVLETTIEDREFITEKTYKPIINGHPFLVLGGIQTLKNLRNAGFHTFGDLIDESYDIEPNLSTRMGMIIDQIDLITVEKLRCMHDIVIYNQRHFFNEDLVKEGIDKDIRYPLEKFCLG